ncbi:MAG: WGR domain-containing protein [Deltaproteobacteria bacterium]|nr:WGR domain-containing protein [Deltaproteobacteria bacterium]
MTSRRFEKAGAGRTLYWEVYLQDRFVCLVWGEVRGIRKTLDRNCGTPEAARAKLAQLVAQQLEDGYRETSAAEESDLDEIEKVLAFDGAPPPDEPPPPKPTFVFARSPELELQCRLSPDDRGPWEIYSDWLIGQGDVRGELAALRRNHKDRDANRLIAMHHAALFGDLAVDDGKDIATELSWRHGFLTGARIKVNDPDAQDTSFDAYVRAFMASPIAQFVERLQLGLAVSSDNDWGPTVRALAASEQAAFLRELRFDVETEWEISWTALGSLDGWVAFPRLEVLRFRAGDGGMLGELELPSLKVFEYESCGISKLEIEAIAAARWPKLERLELWLGAAERGAIGTIAPLRQILDGVGLPALHHLGLCNTELIDELIPALVESKLLPQLRTLDLSHSTLVSSQALVTAAPAFEHLALLSLDRNLLSDHHCDEIRAALPNAKLDDQRHEEEYEGDDDEPAVRYVALWE